MKLRSGWNADVNNWCLKWRKSFSDSTQRWNVRPPFVWLGDYGRLWQTCLTTQRGNQKKDNLFSSSRVHHWGSVQHIPRSGHCRLWGKRVDWVYKAQLGQILEVLSMQRQSEKCKSRLCWLLRAELFKCQNCPRSPRAHTQFSSTQENKEGLVC